MSNSIAISPEQFIFAQDHELKTDSLKIAEAFGKDHSNIIKVVERTLTQVSDSFGKVNFNATEYEQNNNLGFPAKYKMYEMTKDGFAVPSSMTQEMNSDLDKLDNCLISAFTECDEALLHINHANNFLTRWRGDK